MSSIGIQGWVKSKFQEAGMEVTPVGSHGLLVSAAERDDNLVVIAEPGRGSLTRDDVDKIILEYPECSAIVLIRKSADKSAFISAEASRILLDKYGRVAEALNEYGTGAISSLWEFEHRDETYLRRQLETHRSVLEVERVGMSAWKIRRKSGLPRFTIITHGRYEFTVNELLTLLQEHESIDLDAFVVTNPYTGKLSGQAQAAAARVGSRVYLLRDFLKMLHNNELTD